MGQDEVDGDELAEAPHSTAEAPPNSLQHPPHDPSTGEMPEFEMRSEMLEGQELEEEDGILRIMEMGFGREEAVQAVQAAHGDAERALEYLMTGIPADGQDQGQGQGQAASQRPEQHMEDWERVFVLYEKFWRRIASIAALSTCKGDVLAAAELAFFTPMLAHLEEAGWRVGRPVRRILLESVRDVELAARDCDANSRMQIRKLLGWVREEEARLGGEGGGGLLSEHLGADAETEPADRLLEVVAWLATDAPDKRDEIHEMRRVLVDKVGPLLLQPRDLEIIPMAEGLWRLADAEQALSAESLLQTLGAGAVAPSLPRTHALAARLLRHYTSAVAAAGGGDALGLVGLTRRRAEHNLKALETLRDDVDTWHPQRGQGIAQGEHAACEEQMVHMAAPRARAMVVAGDGAKSKHGVGTALGSQPPCRVRACLLHVA